MAIGKIITGQTFGNWLTTTNLMIDEINNASSTFAPGNLVRWGAGGTVVVNTLTATTIQLQGGMTVNAISNNYSTPVDDRTLLTANAIHNLLLDSDKTTIKDTPRDNVANTWVTASYSNVVLYVESGQVAEFANSTVEFWGDTTINGDLTVTKDLIVKGTRTELATQTMVVEDNNIQLNSSLANVDGSGFDVLGSNAFVRLVDTGTNYPVHANHEIEFNESGSGKLLSLYDVPSTTWGIRGTINMNLKDRITIEYPYPALPAGATYSEDDLILGISRTPDFANAVYNSADPAWGREANVLDVPGDEVRYFIETTAPVAGVYEYTDWASYRAAWANTDLVTGNTILKAIVEFDPDASGTAYYWVGEHTSNPNLRSVVYLQQDVSDSNILKIMIDKDLDPMTMTPVHTDNPDLEMYANDIVTFSMNLSTANTHPIVISREPYSANSIAPFIMSSTTGYNIQYKTYQNADKSGAIGVSNHYSTWESNFSSASFALGEITFQPWQPGVYYYVARGNTADPTLNLGGRITVLPRNENMGGNILVEYPRGTTVYKTMTIEHVNTANVWSTNGMPFDPITMDAGDTLVLQDIANTNLRYVDANNWIAFSRNGSTTPINYYDDVTAGVLAHTKYVANGIEYKDPFEFGNTVNTITTTNSEVHFTPLQAGTYWYFANNQIDTSNNYTYGLITVNAPRSGTAGAFYMSTDDKDMVIENPLSFEVTKNHYTTMRIDGEIADFSGTKKGIQLPEDSYAGSVVANGTIRFNQLDQQFEGYANNKWRGLGGGSNLKLIDLNKDTYVQVQDTSDEIHLVTNNFTSFVTDGHIADFKGTKWGLQLPVDDDDVRLSANGVIRYNQSQRMFEGYTSGEWRGLGGVVDLNQDTYIKAGDMNDRLYYVANGSNVSQMTRETMWFESNNYSNTVHGLVPLHYTEKEAVIRVESNPTWNVGEYRIDVSGNTISNNAGVISYEAGNTSILVEPRGVKIDSTGYFQLPMGEEYERPYNAANGMVRILSDGLQVYDVNGANQAYDIPEIYIDGAWKPLSFITNEMSYTVTGVPQSNVEFNNLYTPFVKEEIDVYINGLRIQKSDYTLFTKANNEYVVSATFDPSANVYHYSPNLPPVLDRGDKLTIQYDFQNNMNTAPMHIEDDHSGTMALSMTGVEFDINGTPYTTVNTFKNAWANQWVGNTANIVYTSTFEGVTVDLNSSNTNVAANTTNTWWTTGRTSYQSILHFATPRTSGQIITVEHKPARMIGVNRIDAMSRSELINGFPYRVAFAAGLSVGSGQTSTSTSTGALVINGGVGLSGDLYVGRGVTELSAAGLKTNITDIDSPMDKIQQMHGVEFNWKGDESDLMRGKEYGLIADEVAKVAPSLVTFENNQPQGVKYSKVVALLIEAMKHQQKEIDELKSNMPKKRGRKPKTQG